MELGHLLIRSGLMYPEVPSKVCHDSFCQLQNIVSLQNKYTNYKGIKNNTNFGQITGIQEKLDIELRHHEHENHRALSVGRSVGRS